MVAAVYAIRKHRIALATLMQLLTAASWLLTITFDLLYLKLGT